MNKGTYILSIINIVLPFKFVPCQENELHGNRKALIICEGKTPDTALHVYPNDKRVEDRAQGSVFIETSEFGNWSKTISVDCWICLFNQLKLKRQLQNLTNYRKKKGTF